jgi:glycerophosphoryl diester phosphodiesterase
MIKSFFKFLLSLILFLILFLVVAYFAFAFIEGGFGKKIPAKLPVKPEGSQFLFAHRGVVGKFPENSMESIEQARLLGFRAVEIDIRRTSDNRFILFHDGNAKRLLGIDNAIDSLSYDEIRQRSLRFDNGDTSKCKVVLLEDVLNTYKDNFVYYFDMKLGNFNDVDDLVHLIWQHEISKNVILASPSFLVSLYIEYNYPAIQTAMEGFNAGNEWVWYLIPKKLKPDFLSGSIKKVDEKHIEWLKKQDLLENRIVYGVDSTNYQATYDMGIRNMIIDYWPGMKW